MRQRINLSAACGAIALLFAAAPRTLRAQGPGPMAPAESTKFPAPPPPAKPEPPTLPPDEIIRRFDWMPGFPQGGFRQAGFRQLR